MCPTNDFLPFATGGSANVLSQAAYAGSGYATGNISGIASSAFNNKAIRQATYLVSCLAQFLSNTTGFDVLDDGNMSEVLDTLMWALKAGVSVQPYTSAAGATGTWMPTVICEVTATGSDMESGCIYEDTSSNQFTNLAIFASGATVIRLIPLSGVALPVSAALTLNSGTGPATITVDKTFNKPSYLRVKIWAGGGGGAGSGSASGSAAGDGGDSNFGGASLLLAKGGGAGAWGAGGSPTFGAVIGKGIQPIWSSEGQGGETGLCLVPSTSAFRGGFGGQGPFGDQSKPSFTNGFGGGGGLGGGGTGSSLIPGGGGASGNWIDAIILNPAASYAWSIGLGGTAGGAGTGGAVGGVGGAGGMIVEEHYC